MKKLLKYCLVIAGCCGVMRAQELRADEAIRMALEKNYNVLISKNEQKIAMAQNNFGNAGLSPTVTINGNLTSSKINSNQVFNTGAEQNRTGAKNSGLQASVNADWTVFDGLRMFAIHKRLNLTEDLSALELKRQMENTVYDVIAAYYEIVRVKELIKAAKQDLLLYEERRKIAVLRQEIGSDSKVEVLLSKTDENKVRSVIISLELMLLKAKTSLNTLVGRPISTTFEAVDSITVNYNPDLGELKKSVSSGNTSLLIAKKNELIFDQMVSEARSATLPFITLNSAYILNRNQSEAGVVLSSRQNGINLGVTARWLIFNGGRNTQLVKERNIMALNQRYVTEQTQLDVDALVYVNYQSYLLNKQVLEMEMQNLNDSREVQNISLERYKVGKGNLLETIETQRNLEEAQARYINALYAIKLAEAELLRANGSLVK